MLTCSEKDIQKPNPKYALTALRSFLNEPRNLSEALKYPCSVNAMHSELQALSKRNT